MFFCPNCSNTYDISKEFLTKQQGGAANESEYENLVETVISEKPEADIKKHIDKINIPLFFKSHIYKKLSSKEKELVFNKIEDALPKEKKILMNNNASDIIDSNVAFFVCQNCIYNQKIKEGTLIYSKTSDSSINVSNTDNINMKIYSDILPITRKYVCPNTECPSYKDYNLKEAIVYRAKGGFNTTYICKTCRMYWQI